MNLNDLTEKSDLNFVLQFNCLTDKNNVVSTIEFKDVKSLNDINKLKKMKDYLGDLITSNGISGNAISNPINNRSSASGVVNNYNATPQTTRNSNNSQGNTAKVSKPKDINFTFNFNVNPKDYKNSFMDIFNQSDLPKLLAKHITNNYKENSALKGYTPSAKINILS